MPAKPTASNLAGRPRPGDGREPSGRQSAAKEGEGVWGGRGRNAVCEQQSERLAQQNGGFSQGSEARGPNNKTSKVVECEKERKFREEWELAA